MKNSPSIWEKQSFLACDVAIVGAGITGLSTAATLKEKKPELDVIVLERGLLPTGASTKNAGFACFGSVSELLNDITALGENGTLALVEKRVMGLERTKQRLGTQKIGLVTKGGYELVFEEDAEALDRIEDINQLLKPLFQDPVYQLANEKIEQFGLGHVSSLIENKYEGQLDTGMLIKSLWEYCASLGIQIYTGAEVKVIHKDKWGLRLECLAGTFSAKKVGICTNAFSKKILDIPIDLNPGRGLVLSVIPERPIKVNGTFHYEEGYYYFRDYHQRLLFGGGRNLDIEGERTTDFGINQRIKDKLIHDLELIILPNQKFKVEMEWSGIMAFGEKKEPIVKQISDNMVVGVRLGGMGVAIGSLVGEEVAKNILELI